MSNGANSIHKQLRTELEDYIKSQYFGKSPLLLSALGNRIDDEGLLYQKPFIESSPAYVTVQNGIETASIEPWMKDYFCSWQKQVSGFSDLHLLTRFLRLKQRPEAKICLYQQAPALVKQNVLCGRFLLKWLLKQGTPRSHGQTEVFEQLLCIQ